VLTRWSGDVHVVQTQGGDVVIGLDEPDDFSRFDIQILDVS